MKYCKVMMPRWRAEQKAKNPRPVEGCPYCRAMEVEQGECPACKAAKAREEAT